jgi:Big-like domain-containing protein/putative Ig domain-containing protein
VSRRLWRGRARAVFALTVPALCALSIIGAAVLAGPAQAGAQRAEGQHATADALEPPTITSADNATFNVEQAGSFTVTTTPGNDQNGDGLVALSESGTLPDNVTFVDNGDGTGTLAGTPDDDAVGSYPIILTASNGVEPDATQNFTLVVDSSTQVAPSTVTIDGPSSINATDTYDATASAPGALPAPTFTLASGAPSWLSVDPNAGEVSGAPPAGTTGFEYQVTATNSVGSATSAVQSVTVVVAPTSVTITGPDSQVVGTAYQATATASGADVAPTYSLASGAPSWLSIDPSSGVISGTIPEGNPPFYGYSVTATDSDGSATSSEQFVTIDSGNSAVSLNAVPSGTVPAGSPVRFTATVSETAGSGALSGTVSFTRGNVKLSSCTNLSLTDNQAKCTITFPSVGNFNVTATYENDPFFNESFASVLEQVVSANTPVFTSPSNTTATVGSAFSFNVSANGSPEPNLTESGALPSGVTFQAGPAGSATISGTAVAGTGGSYPITLKATSSGGSAKQAFTLTVDEAPAITSASSATTNVGLALSFSVTTSGFPAAMVTESGSLPTGVKFKASANGSATIKGTPGPGTGGTYPLTLSAANGIGSAGTQDFVLTVNQGPVFTSASATTVTVGTSFDFPVSASGSPAPNITETGTLPSGVSFEPGLPGSASITGSAAAHTGGAYTVTLKAKGSAGTTTQSFTLTVDQPPVITSATSAGATVGTAFSFKVKSTGFPVPTLSESGSLPAGLTFTPNSNGTATIAGTPAPGSDGTYDITIDASNGVGSPAAQLFVLTVSG